MGSANADLTVQVRALPRAGETITGGALAILPGGKSANQAAAAARLGEEVGFIGSVGADSHGDTVLAALADAGVDTSTVQRVDTATGTALIFVDDAGENFIVVSAGANADLTPDVVTQHSDVIRGAKVLGLCLEIPLESVMTAARIASDIGVPVVCNPSPLEQAKPELLELVDVLVVNEHELGHFVQPGPWPQVHRALVDKHNIHAAVVTLGGRGSVVLEDSGVTEIDAHKVDVVDTTGCGDATVGALMAGISRGMSLADAARLAAAASGFAASGLGAQASYGSAADIERLLHP
ncbi:ribokinase [Corynebacterium sp. TAE3-ERU12]|uniref:ribokinase n=1 Tax=Corynebacterium sp. TAE3-ERU12 TaxID=2849491 RepID=UPI00351D3ECD